MNVTDAALRACVELRHRLDAAEARAERAEAQLHDLVVAASPAVALLRCVGLSPSFSAPFPYTAAEMIERVDRLDTILRAIETE